MGATKMTKVLETLRWTPSKLNCSVLADAACAINLRSRLGET